MAVAAGACGDDTAIQATPAETAGGNTGGDVAVADASVEAAAAPADSAPAKDVAVPEDALPVFDAAEGVAADSADVPVVADVPDGAVAPDEVAAPPEDSADAAPDVAMDVEPDAASDVAADAVVEDAVADAVAADVAVDVAPEADADGATDAMSEVAQPPQCVASADCAKVGALAACHVWACAAGSCVQENDKDGAPCDDGNACTSPDACKGGACASATPKLCDDGNVCTTELCNPVNAACSTVPSAAFCDDLNPCTDADSCKNGVCASGVAKTCDDANPCTADKCEAATGVCLHAELTATCDDGSKCTVNDACAAGKCTGSPGPSCTDNNPCTDDTCDPAAGCVSVANKAPCADATKCLLGTCGSGACQPGSGAGCDDNNVCTTDTCDATKGCVYTPVAAGTACGKGDFCVDAPKCNAGQCGPAVQFSCDDSNPCTDDGCDPAAGCTWTPNKAACDDGDKCTSGDACSNGKCVTGKPVDVKVFCDDSNACTDDSCDKTKGCGHVSKVGACDDANPCTAGEVCANSACGGGKPATCDDGKVCTQDNCDVKTGDCSWVAKAGPCEDANACTVGDVCQGAACLPGAVTTCDDKEPCTVDSCDPKIGCVFKASPGADALVCDGTVANGLCFKAVAATANWTEAEAACGKWGGHLAKISSAAENTVVRNVANGICGANSTPWIGVNDIAVEGTFVWPDGTAATYTNWAGGEPNNCVACCTVANAGEDSGQMLASGQWNDVCTAAALGCYVCRRPAPTVTCADPSKCLAGGTCVNTKCTGASTNCDDGNSCTTDACDANGKGCVHTALADGTKCGVGVCGGGHCTPGVDLAWPATSCVAIPTTPTPTDYLYWIDPDGAGPIAPVQTGCTWSVPGGGWTMVAIVADDGQNTWTWNARTLWSTDKTTFGAPTVPSKDFKSPLYHNLPFKDVLFFHQPSGQWAQYNAVGDGKISLAQKVEAVGPTPICYTAAQGYPLAAGTIKASATLCNTNLYFTPDDHDGNAVCGDDDQTFGPAWNTLTNATVCFFDDPGITGGLGPVVSAPAVEQANVGFGMVLGLNKGTAASGQNRMILLVR